MDEQAFTELAAGDSFDEKQLLQLAETLGVRILKGELGWLRSMEPPSPESLLGNFTREQVAALLDKARRDARDNVLRIIGSLAWAVREDFPEAQEFLTWERERFRPRIEEILSEGFGWSTLRELARLLGVETSEDVFGFVHSMGVPREWDVWQCLTREQLAALLEKARNYTDDGVLSAMASLAEAVEHDSVEARDFLAWLDDRRHQRVTEIVSGDAFEGEELQELAEMLDMGCYDGLGFAYDIGQPYRGTVWENMTKEQVLALFEKAKKDGSDPALRVVGYIASALAPELEEAREFTLWKQRREEEKAVQARSLINSYIGCRVAPPSDWSTWDLSYSDSDLVVLGGDSSGDNQEESEVDIRDFKYNSKSIDKDDIKRLSGRLYFKHNSYDDDNSFDPVLSSPYTAAELEVAIHEGHITGVSFSVSGSCGCDWFSSSDPGDAPDDLLDWATDILDRLVAGD